jgi:fructan beta-fructosidase
MYQHTMSQLGSCLLIILCAFMIACRTDSKKESTYYQETYRPQFHFSPEKNWINDPNGLVYLDGEYHLFYQYNPYGDKWGHMSWGHAVSTDLLHWQHLPVALTEYADRLTGDSTMIFSGTAIIDKNNSAGFGSNAMIAIYTSNVHKDNKGLAQHQSLAYSTDKGRTWKRYDKNPVLNINRKDFRDPKVFWHEPKQKWVMVLVVPDLYTVQFYESKNLLTWKLTGEFTGIGDTTRIWECPDLYELKIEGQPNKTKWVLSLSGGHPQGPKFVGMQYFVGEFDGNTFHADSTQYPRYVDYGKDFYAGIVYNNLPDQRTIMIGWLNNWTYANQLPTSPWRGAMSLPRELSLINTPTGLTLRQQPIAALEKLRIKKMETIENQELSGSFEFSAELTEETNIEIVSESGDKLILSYNNGNFSIDRTKTLSDFNPDFASLDAVSIPQYSPSISLRVIVDQSVVEIFITNGEQVLTELFFLRGGKVKVKSNGEVKITESYEIKSVWRE